MSNCYIDLSIEKNNMKELYSWLDKNVEIGAVLYYDISKYNVNSKITKNVHSSKIVKGNDGDSMSVNVEPASVNLHTHPHNCYEKENTVVGWPSGEDMREVIKFSMKGNLAHFVVTKEGTYCIQVNPLMIESLKQMKDSDLRGAIISLIEFYFQSTHNFRTKEFQEWMKKMNKKTIKPTDFILFCNNFELTNIESNKNNCGDVLKCNKVPLFKYTCKKTESNNKCYRQMDMKEYLDAYGDDLEIYSIDSNGDDIKKLGNGKKYLETKLPNVLSWNKYNKDVYSKSINSHKKKCNGKVVKWKPTEWFNVCFFKKNSKTMPFFRYYYDCNINLQQKFGNELK